LKLCGVDTSSKRGETTSADDPVKGNTNTILHLSLVRSRDPVTDSLGRRSPLAGPVAGVRKVVLACSSLEEGYDGVGDYCRRLAIALKKHGVDCALLGLSDRHTDRVIEAETALEASRVELVRLPVELTTPQRAAAARTALERWQPDWVSLQMVSYGFNQRGILSRELRWMPTLLAPYRRHVMLHELWIGLYDWSPWKDVAVGALQRRALLTLLRRLSPVVVHTTTPVLRHTLRRRGINAGLLPLFGNIPVSDRPAGSWLFEALQQEGIVLTAAERQSFWLFGIFGGIAPDWSAEPLLSRLAEIAARAGRRAIVVSLGHVAPYAVSRFETWRRSFPQMVFARLGPRSAAEVSEFLNSVDFCLTPYSLQFIGKSGSAAAALEHGVPVIVSWGYEAQDDGTVPAASDPVIWKNDGGLEARMRRPASRRKIYDAPEQRALELVRDLARASQPSEAAPRSRPAVPSPESSPL
jgi:hypothetical protein